MTAPGIRLEPDDVSNGVLELFVGPLFADDTVAAAGSIEQAKRAVDLLHAWCKLWGVEFGIAKCGLMVVAPKDSDSRTVQVTGPDGDTVDCEETQEMSDLRDGSGVGGPIEIGGEVAPIVSSYEYLGLDFNCTLDRGIVAEGRAVKITKAVNACARFIGSTSTPFGLRAPVLSSLVGSGVTYGGEILGCLGSNKSTLKPLIKAWGGRSQPSGQRKLDGVHGQRWIVWDVSE